MRSHGKEKSDGSYLPLLPQAWNAWAKEKRKRTAVGNLAYLELPRLRKTNISGRIMLV
jgi:hypothetical protein